MEPMAAESKKVSTDPLARRFWQRQFTGEATPLRIRFDLLAGLVLPAVCVAFDPIVFRRPVSAHHGFLSEWAVPSYSLMGVSVLSLLGWLVVRGPPAFLAGFLLSGAAFSLVLGIVLLPLSLAGLAMAGLGFLGFAPFLSCLTFTRNGAQALAAARSRGPDHRLTITGRVAITVAVLLAATPFLGHFHVSGQATRQAKSLLGEDFARSWKTLETLDRMVRNPLERTPFTPTFLDRLTHDMTKDDIKSILGKPPHIWPNRPAPRESDDSWEYETRQWARPIVVIFFDEDGRYAGYDHDT